MGADIGYRSAVPRYVRWCLVLLRRKRLSQRRQWLRHQGLDSGSLRKHTRDHSGWPTAMAMGNYFFTNADGVSKVEYSFGYFLDAMGNVRINLHHSSMPYTPAN